LSHTVKETAHEQRDLLLFCSDWIDVIALFASTNFHTCFFHLAGKIRNAGVTFVFELYIPVLIHNGYNPGNIGSLNT
jgi:hypothetical protein